MSEFVDYEIHSSIGVIKINNPPVNAMSVNKGVPQGILDAIKNGEHDPKVKKLLLVGKGRNFCGGADISEFGGKYNPDMATLMDLIEYMDTVTKPIFGALSGPTMGGGLELALACHYRCGIEGVLLGLPEVKLGIMPGAGGTQRLPRLIDVRIATDMMIKGDPVGAQKGLKLGIIDKIVEGDILEGALKWIKEDHKRTDSIRRTSELPAQGNIDFESERAKVQKKWKGYPAPLAIVDTIELGYNKSFSDGILFERDQINHLMGTNESLALRHLFFTERLAAKIPDIDKNTLALNIKKAAVIGGGLMGGGITMNFANAGIPVTIVETSDQALNKGINTIKGNYAATVSKGRLTQDQMNTRMALITPTVDFNQISDADIVIEAVYEEMNLKKEIFQKLDSIAKVDAILATNTSTLDVNEIANVTKRPQSVVGTHFFSPANVMRLLEVVRGESTSDSVLATTMNLGKKINKVSVCVGVCDGFVGNRMIHHYIREAGYLIEEGALPQQVDKAIEKFGFAMGPFRMSDLAGLDIGWAIRKRQAANRTADERYSRVADLICEMGRFGQKTGAGFYKYESGSRIAIPDETIDRLVAQESQDQGIDRREISAEEIVGRLLYSLINEGAKILEEGIAQRSSDIDVIYAYGYGFPRFRGGPMFYADTVGLRKIVDSIKSFREGYRGEHWVAAPLLLSLASKEKKFVDWVK